MAVNYPASLDTFTNPASNSSVANPSHSQQHSDANDAIEALQAKVGANGSAVVTSHDYKIAQLESLVTSSVAGAKSIYQDVRNQSGSALSKATPVYVSGSEGASGKILISAASNATEATSSKTMGITTSAISNNSNGQVISEGILEGIDTTGAADGDPVWLGVNGAKIYGLINKTAAPAHLVFLGIVIRGGQALTGSMYVKIQNGFELQELHNVEISSLINGNILSYDSTSQTWKNTNTLQSTSSTVPLIIKAASGQTANLQEWKDSAGTVLSKIDAYGNFSTLNLYAGGFVGLGAAPNAATRTIISPTIPSLIGLIVKGAASQTANLQEWQNSAGTVKASIGPNGEFVATGLSTSQYSEVTAYGVLYFGGYIPNTKMIVVPNAANYAGIIVKGVASQTANLQEWQNSAGTILSKVDPSGNITAPSYNLSNSLYSLRKTIKKSVGNGQGAAANTTYDLFDFAFSSSLQGTFYIQVSLRGPGYGQNLTFLVPTTYAMDWLGQGYSGNPFANSSTWVSLTPLTFSGRHLMVSDDLKLQLKVNGNTLSMRIKTTAELTNGGNSPYFDVYIQHSEEFANCTITEYSSTGTDSTSQSTLANFLSSKSGTTEIFNPTTIFSNSANNTPLKIKGFASQSTNLQEWQNSSGTTLAVISNSGTIKSGAFASPTDLGAYVNFNSTSGAMLIGTRSSSNIGLIVKGESSQSANLQEWQNSSGTVLSRFDASGSLYLGTQLNVNGGGGQGASIISIAGAASIIPIIAKGASSQTADLQQWQNSSGTVLSSITSNGVLDLRNTSASSLTNSNSGTVGPRIDLWGGQYGIGLDTGRTTIFFPSSGGASFRKDNNTGTSILDIPYNGLVGFNIINQTSAQVFINNSTAANVGLIVKAAASQTANLQEWQNSAGTVLAKIYSNGAAEFVGGGVAITGGSSLNVSSNIYSVFGKISTGNGTNTPPAQLTTFASSASTIPLIARGYTSQTANLQEWQDSSGAVLSSISYAGNLTIAAGQGVSTQYVTGRTSGAGAYIELGTSSLVLNTRYSTLSTIVRGAASQTADLQQWQNSSGTSLLSITSTGDIKSGRSSTISVNTATTLDTVALSGFTTLEYTISIKQGSKIRSSKILVHTNGTSVDSTEYGIIEMGGGISGVALSASVSGTDALLQVTITDAATTNATVKLIKVML